MHTHTEPQTFYLTRHGQSEYNKLEKIGGDSDLTSAGEAYAVSLAEFTERVICQNEKGETIPARLWTSTLRRTRSTVKHFKHPTLTVPGEAAEEVSFVQLRHKTWSNLDEIYAGICDGMTYREIEERFPEEFARRKTNKLAYRYPRGESYLDVIHRLEPLMLEMERFREPLIICGHQGVLRVIYAYWMGLAREEAPHVSIPMNTVIKLRPHAYGCYADRNVLGGDMMQSKDGQDEPGIYDPPSH